MTKKNNQGPVSRDLARAVIIEKLDFYFELLKMLERDEAYGYRTKKGSITIRKRGT